MTRNTRVFQDIETNILKLLDIINTKVDCPLIFLDTDILQSSSAIDKHRKILWEIGENYDTYIYVKRSVIECLDTIKNYDRNLTGDDEQLDGFNTKVLETVGFINQRLFLALNFSIRILFILFY